MKAKRNTVPSLARMQPSLSGTWKHRHSLQYAMLVRNLIAWCDNELEQNDPISMIGI